MEKNMSEYIEEQRFSEGIICPECGSKRAVKNGKRKDGTQRYKCNDCGKRFVAAAKSVMQGTRKDVEVWRQYIDCMLQGKSVAIAAEECGICKNTAFAWRHKILDALQILADNVQLNGVVEVDQAMFPVLYKGNHKGFKLPRNAIKADNYTYYIPDEKVCVPFAFDEEGRAILKITDRNELSEDGLHALLGDRIEEDSQIVAKKNNIDVYQLFVDENGLELKEIEALRAGGLDQENIEHMQSISEYGLALNKFINRFRGVSTKYLNNYLVWYNFMSFNDEWDDEKREELIGKILSVVFEEYNRDIPKRPMVPVLVD